MRNWKATPWLTALALTPFILSGELLPANAALGLSASSMSASSMSSGASSLGASDVLSAAAADELPPAAVGSLTLQWTLSGRREALDCGGLGIDRFQVSLTASSGGDAEPWDAPCDAFQISIDLAPGSYTGEAVLVDRLDRAVTLNVQVEQVEVVGGRDVVKVIDFPMAAFL